MYVRYVYLGKIRGDFLFCKEIRGSSDAEDPLDIIDSYDCKYPGVVRLYGSVTDRDCSVLGIHQPLI
jgi:hypothetical protein